MFWEIKNGTKVTIYGFYDCWIPPVGFGCHSETGEIKKTDVIKRSAKTSEQYWERTLLPKDYDKKRKAELLAQKDDMDYFDPELEKFREQEWKRRLYGVWFYNNGNPTYITGEHYFYINYWSLDDGYPKFRDPDRKRYYVVQYAVQDERCAGILEASNRRSGKSYRVGCFITDYTSRSADSNGGMQSKTDRDAANLFKGKIVTPFKRLPDFFRPEIDSMAGSNPDKELKFTTTTKRGKNAMQNFASMGLNSFINFLSSGQYAYDGWKIFRYGGDEVGKTATVNVYDRWQVVKYCLRVGKKWIGKAVLTTTVEKLKGEVSQTESFKKLWLDSNPDERDANGHTKSGLYKYMTPAYEMYEFDKFGFPLSEEGKEFYLNTRAGLQHDPHLLASEISKNPFNEKELFFTDGDKCLYDAMKLNERADWLSSRPACIERGNFLWKNGERFTEVVWEPSKNGRYYITHLLKPGESNNVRKEGNTFSPLNQHLYSAGADPFKYDTTKDDRRSDCAAFVLKKFDAANRESPYNEAFVCMYKHRAPTTSMANEDLLKMCWYYGSPILFERNVDHWLHYFKAAGCYSFLIKFPGEDMPGIYTDGAKKVVQQLCDYTESYIANNIQKVYFQDLIQEWFEFKVDETTKYDLAMAAGFTLIGATRKFYKKEEGPNNEVTNFIRQYKATAS